MLAKSSTIFALFALAVRIAVAAPPACLLAAVNTQPDPSQLKAVCSGSNATAVEKFLCQNCGANTEAAMSGFASVCSGAGVMLSSSNSCASATASGSASDAASSTASGPAHTGTASGGLAAGAAGGASTTSTAAAAAAASASASSGAAPVDNAGTRLGMDLVGMAALGAFGFMLAL